MRKLGIVLLAGAALVVVLAIVAAFRVRSIPVDQLARRTPHQTAMMIQREREAGAKGRAFRVDQRWVPYAGISPTLRAAVLVAEDDKFFSHGGLDWREIQASARTNLKRGRIVRGGSTITQQLARNLYLGDARTVSRKLEEALLAVRLENALSKRRILELYLNLIEWGDGIFGCEAAARRYFGVSAGSLTPRQALLLAAVIINPRRFSVLAPGSRIERRVQVIASRMRRRGLLTEDQYLVAVGRAPAPRPWYEWLFGGGRDTTQAPPGPATTPAPADSTVSPDTTVSE